MLNKLGLHIFRIKLANLFLSLRRIQVHGLKRPPEFQQFVNDGILELENFLPEEEFETLRQEIKNTITTIDSNQSIQSYGEQGFGSKHIHKWGFDRYDGGTLNRFYNITNEQPNSVKFLNNKKLIQLTTLLSGTYHSHKKYHIYKLFHGNENDNADNQKAIHRDTFHSAIKLWYFLDDVKPEHGPFHYAPGTNRMTKNRLNWEKQRSIKASYENKGGAFRIEKSELDKLKDGSLRSYPVKANTLVIADIRGFHCRGMGLENRERLSIYANIRPAPFLFAFHADKIKRLFRIS